MAKNQTQLELIDSIINDGVVVKVGEHDIRLIPPPRAKVAHLHQPPPPEEKMTDEVRDKFSLYNVSLESVQACIPGLNDDQSAQLVALAGGEDSQLTTEGSRVVRSESYLRLCAIEDGGCDRQGKRRD